MARLTLAQVERHLWTAADILRGSADPSEYRDLIVAVLCLKRANDEPEGPLPDDARWERLGDPVLGGPGQQLPRALAALETRPGHEQLRDLFAQVRFSAVDDRRLIAVLDHFGRVRLRDEDLLYPTLLGDAYELFLKRLADASGSKGGEFFTPRPIVRLITELARPQPGMRIYDPCAGTAGMLVAAAKYVEDHGGAPDDLTLAGQDTNVGAWSSGVANMLLHGVDRFMLEPTDSLAQPIAADGGFDLVVSNPPFSMNYRLDDVPNVEQRMPYGRTPELGRKADLMFLQHMLDMARGRNGRVISVLPMGVLFRGGREQEIRRGLLDADLIEAVIGLAPNLFYGTGIPACLLVLRAGGQRDPEHRGSVLFINAGREYQPGRAQNALLPEHVKKIAAAFHSRQEIPGFSSIVPREVLAGNAENLTVERYVTSVSRTERQDLQAHIQGGMPVDEIAEQLPLLAAYGLEPQDLFLARVDSAGYMSFFPPGERPGAASLSAVAHRREQELWAAYEEGWLAAVERIAAHISNDHEPRATGHLASIRGEVEKALLQPLSAVGLLGAHNLGGIVDGWWQDSDPTLRSVAASGFTAVMDAWCEEVEAVLGASEDSTPRRARPGAAQREAAYRHPVAKALLPDFLPALSQEQAARADLDEQLREAQADLVSDVEITIEEATSLRKLKLARAKASARVRELEAGFSLTDARSRLSADDVRFIVLDIVRSNLADRLQAQLAEQKDELIGAYERWEEKYGLSFQEIEDRLPGAAETSRALRQTPWSGRGHRGKHDEQAALLFNVIEAEKLIEREDAKLEIKQHLVLLTALDPSAKRDLGSERLPLGDILRTTSFGVTETLSTDRRGIPVVAMRNLTGVGLDLSDVRFATDQGRNTPRLRPGDVLVGHMRPQENPSFLRVAVWRDELPEASFSQTVTRLVPDTDRIHLDYLEAWLRHPRVRQQLRPLSRSARPDRDLLNMAIDLPGMEEQRRLAKEIGKLGNERADRRIQLAKVNLIRAALTSALIGSGD